MNAENAKLVNDTIALFILSYCLLILMDKAPVKNKIKIINNNKRFFIGCTILAMIYPVFEITNFFLIKK